jgi:hypothetical protein
MSMRLADEIRRWQQARRMATSLPSVFPESQRIAVDDREVVVLRRRSPRLGERVRSRASGRVDQ